MEELLKEAGINENIVNDFVSSYFPNPTVFDYKVVSSAFALRASLPPSHARTAIVNAMRGRGKSKVAKNLEWFGVVEGMKKYKVGRLNLIVDHIHKLLESADVLEKEDIYESEENPAPCFISYCGDSQHIVDKQRCLSIAKVIEECGKKYGKDEPIPEKKVVIKVNTDKLQEKLIKSGIWHQVNEECYVVFEKFMNENPDWESSRSYHKSYRSKSIKKDSVLVTWYCSNVEYSAILRVGSYSDYKNTVPVIFTEWDSECKNIIKWHVKMKLVSRGY